MLPHELWSRWRSRALFTFALWCIVVSCPSCAFLVAPTLQCLRVHRSDNLLLPLSDGDGKKSNNAFTSLFAETATKLLKKESSKTNRAKKRAQRRKGEYEVSAKDREMEVDWDFGGQWHHSSEGSAFKESVPERQPISPADLNELIKACETAEAVLLMVEKSFERFSPVNILTALHRLSMTVDRSRIKQLHADWRFEKLVEITEELIEGGILSASDLTRILDSFNRLQYVPKSLSDIRSQFIEALRNEECDVRAGAAGLTALLRVCGPQGDDLWSAVASYYSTYVEEMNRSEVAVLIHAMRRCPDHMRATLAPALRAVAERAGMLWKQWAETETEKGQGEETIYSSPSQRLIRMGDSPDVIEETSAVVDLSKTLHGTSRCKGIVLDVGILESLVNALSHEMVRKGLKSHLTSGRSGNLSTIVWAFLEMREDGGHWVSSAADLRRFKSAWSRGVASILPFLSIFLLLEQASAGPFQHAPGGISESKGRSLNTQSVLLLSSFAVSRGAVPVSALPLGRLLKFWAQGIRERGMEGLEEMVRLLEPIWTALLEEHKEGKGEGQREDEERRGLILEFEKLLIAIAAEILLPLKLSKAAKPPMMSQHAVRLKRLRREGKLSSEKNNGKGDPEDEEDWRAWAAPKIIQSYASMGIVVCQLFDELCSIIAAQSQRMPFKYLAEVADSLVATGFGHPPLLDAMAERLERELGEVKKGVTREGWRQGRGTRTRSFWSEAITIVRCLQTLGRGGDTELEHLAAAIGAIPFRSLVEVADSLLTTGFAHPPLLDAMAHRLERELAEVKKRTATQIRSPGPEALAVLRCLQTLGWGGSAELEHLAGALSVGALGGFESENLNSGPSNQKKSGGIRERHLRSGGNVPPSSFLVQREEREKSLQREPVKEGGAERRGPELRRKSEQPPLDTARATSLMKTLVKGIEEIGEDGEGEGESEGRNRDPISICAPLLEKAIASAERGRTDILNPQSAKALTLAAASLEAAVGSGKEKGDDGGREGKGGDLSGMAEIFVSLAAAAGGVGFAVMPSEMVSEGASGETQGGSGRRVSLSLSGGSGSGRSIRVEGGSDAGRLAVVRAFLMRPWLFRVGALRQLAAAAVEFAEEQGDERHTAAVRALLVDPFRGPTSVVVSGCDLSFLARARKLVNGEGGAGEEGGKKGSLLIPDLCSAPEGSVGQKARGRFRVDASEASLWRERALESLSPAIGLVS